MEGLIRIQRKVKALEEKQEEERSKVGDLRGRRCRQEAWKRDCCASHHRICTCQLRAARQLSFTCRPGAAETGLLGPAHPQVHAMVGVLMGDTDPQVTVVKVGKVPQQTYTDTGGWTAESGKLRNLQRFLSLILNIKRR